MRRFDDTGLWEFLKNFENTPASINAGLDTLLERFAAYLHTYCREEKSIAEKTRSLNYAKSELVMLLESKRFDSKRYVCIRTVIKQAIYFIEGELNLIKLDLEHPERFIEFPSDTPPLARWAGDIVDLIEYHIAPQAAGMILKPSGEPMNYEESIELLERIYGIKISNPPDRRGKALDRQNNTKFQDKMRQMYLEEAKKRNK